MAFQDQPGEIRWKMHFRSSPQDVFDALATPQGRARYWAERSPQRDGVVHFEIEGYPPFSGPILACEPPRRWALQYYGTTVVFTLEGDASCGTDLELHATDVPEAIRWEMVAGWVSVLMAMKAAVDYGVDLRNHDPARCWVTGYADN